MGVALRQRFNDLVGKRDGEGQLDRRDAALDARLGDPNRLLAVFGTHDGDESAVFDALNDLFFLHRSVLQ